MSAKEARAYAADLIADAIEAISLFGSASRRLAEIARFIVERRY